jgi:hypothetical protein
VPKKPKPSRIRDRELKRHTKRQRADRLRARADGLRLEAAIAGIYARQEEARGDDDAQADREREKQRNAEKAQLLDAEADVVHGRPLKDSEADERARNLRRAIVERLESQAESWEGTLVDHEANIVEIEDDLRVHEAIPEADRDDDWQDELERLQDDRASNQRNIEQLERALEALDAELAATRAAAPKGELDESPGTAATDDAS